MHPRPAPSPEKSALWMHGLATELGDGAGGAAARALAVAGTNLTQR